MSETRVAEPIIPTLICERDRGCPGRLKGPNCINPNLGSTCLRESPNRINGSSKMPASKSVSRFDLVVGIIAIRYPSLAKCQMFLRSRKQHVLKNPKALGNPTKFLTEFQQRRGSFGLYTFDSRT